MRRLIVFAHYDPAGQILPRVIYYLRALEKLGQVIFVTTAEPSAAELKKVTPHVVEALCRPNVGYDFMSWQTGIALADGWRDLDELVLCNDSCYAPIFAFEDMFSAMDHDGSDFWGVTANRQISAHIQSYFMVFRRSVLAKPEFWNFWRGVQVQKTKEELILKYEVGLSQLLHGFGLRSSAYFSIDSLLPRILMNSKFTNVPALLFQEMANGKIATLNDLGPLFPNPTLSLWRMLLQSRTPILKVSLIRTATPEVRRQILQMLRRISSYPVEMIEEQVLS